MNMSPLNDLELDSVNGGFAEENRGLPTAGMNIVCPKCGSKQALSFHNNVLYEPKIGSVEYACKCGCRFVCYKGKVILRKKWDDLCVRKGIHYPF